VSRTSAALLPVAPPNDNCRNRDEGKAMLFFGRKKRLTDFASCAG
jgi:hypothetical protein